MALGQEVSRGVTLREVLGQGLPDGGEEHQRDHRAEVGWPRPDEADGDRQDDGRDVGRLAERVGVEQVEARRERYPRGLHGDRARRRRFQVHAAVQVHCGARWEADRQVLATAGG